MWQRASSLITGLSSWRWSTAANVYICCNRLHGSLLAWNAVERWPWRSPGKLRKKWWQGPSRGFSWLLSNFVFHAARILPYHAKMLCRYLLLFLPPSAGKPWNMCQLPGGILLGSAVYECLWSWRGHISSVLYCCRRDGNLRGKGQGRFSSCLDPTMQTILYWLYCSCIGKGWYCWYFNTKISLPVCHCSWLPRHFF